VASPSGTGPNPTKRRIDATDTERYKPGTGRALLVNGRRGYRRSSREVSEEVELWGGLILSLSTRCSPGRKSGTYTSHDIVER